MKKKVFERLLIILFILLIVIHFSGYLLLSYQMGEIDRLKEKRDTVVTNIKILQRE